MQRKLEQKEGASICLLGSDLCLAGIVRVVISETP